MKISQRSRSLFWVLVVAATVVLTWIGLSQYYPQTNTLRYLPDRIFRLVKTLTGNDPIGSGVEPANLPLALIGAKIAVTLILLRALLKIVEKVFQEQYTQFRAALKKNHLIVVGAGGKGTVLMQDYLARTGKTAVAVEQQADHKNLAELRRNGHIVVIGNAGSADTLDHAGALKADEVICLGSGEESGIQTAARLSALYAKHRPGRRLRCYVRLDNPRLVDVFRSHGLGSSGNGVDIRFFNLHKMLARRFFHRLPQQLSDSLKHPQAHIRFVLFGFGDAAQALLLQGLRVFHLLPGQQCSWAVCVEGAAAAERRFTDRYPQARQIADVSFHEDDGCIRRCLVEQQNTLPAEGVPVVICASADSRRNLDTAGEVLQASAGQEFPVYVYGSSGRIAPLLEGGARHRLRFFGSDDELCGYELITGNAQDRLAQAIHADYLRQIGGLSAGSTSESAAYQTAWDDLNEDGKDANRAQADHIVYKLLLCGKNFSSPPEFSAAETEQLAAAEHRRWAAHRYLNGWTYGEVRNDTAKQHPSLVAWEVLSEAEKQKDRDTVLRLPELLRDPSALEY